jgi:hypothetical protein
MRREEGSTDFAMEERFSGLMLPLVRRSLPDFGPIFERYANDLKDAADERHPIRRLETMGKPQGPKRMASVEIAQFEASL